MRILIIEDEENLANAIAHLLTGQKYQAEAVHDGQDGLDYGMSGQYDLIILDIMLPRLNGFQVAARLREAGIDTPILMLTARDEVSDRVRGLDSGADDYLTKPFASEELLARVRAMTRRQGKVVLNELVFGDLTLTLDNSVLACGKKSIHLSFKEFEVLKILMGNPRQIVPKESLIVRVWGVESEAVDNNLEAYISFLRKKLFYLGSRVQIVSQRRLGYQLEGEVE